eukprot:Sspe_Gene.50465::Locus_28092_Transcript_1_1_Confidence_1.000_Length_4469::g.50465::m.50465
MVTGLSDADYIRSIRLHRTLDTLTRRVLTARPGSQHDTLLTLRQGCDELLLSLKASAAENSSNGILRDPPASRNGTCEEVSSEGSSKRRRRPSPTFEDERIREERRTSLHTDSPFLEVDERREAKVNSALLSLREHLMATDHDIQTAIYDWLNEQNGIVGPSPRGSRQGSVLGTDATTDDGEEGFTLDPAGIARGVVQTFLVLQDALTQALSKAADDNDEGNLVKMSLVVTVGSREPFKQLCDEFLAFQETCQGHAEMKTATHPIKSQHDEFRGVTKEEHLLLAATIYVRSRGGKEFEICVNIVGGCTYRNDPKTSFDFYDIITSFGQVTATKLEDHKHLCSADAVVRVNRLPEAAHHFKLTLVRVTEHIMHRVIHDEFIHDAVKKGDELRAMPSFSTPSLRGEGSLPQSAQSSARNMVPFIAPEASPRQEKA